MDHLILAKIAKEQVIVMKGLYRGTNCATRVAVPTPPCSGHTIILILLILILNLLLLLIILILILIITMKFARQGGS